MSVSIRDIAHRFNGFRLAVALSIAMGLFFLVFPGSITLLEFMELKTLDIRFKLRGERAPSPDVVMVLVDDASIEALGRWPWPRAYFGELLDRLTEDGAKAVGLDIIFSEPEDNPLLVGLTRLNQMYEAGEIAFLGPAAMRFGIILEQSVEELIDSDQVLADAMRRHGGVISSIVFHTFEGPGEHSAIAATEEVPQELLDELEAGEDLPYEFLDDDDAFLPEHVRDQAYLEDPGPEEFSVPVARGVLLPIDMFVDASAGLGFVNFTPDIDGGLRWEHTAVEFMGRRYPSIGIRMLMEYYGLGFKDLEALPGHGVRLGQKVIPTDGQGRMLINYYGPIGTIEAYSIVDVMDGLLPPDTFRDKAVLIGGAATGLGDAWLTPFDPSLPGVEKHATVLSNFMQDDFISKPPWARLLALALILAGGLVLGHLIPRMPSVLHVLALTLGAFAALLALIYAFFTTGGVWVNMVYPALNLFVVSVGVVVYQYFTEEREKRRIKTAFKMYLNDALVDQLAENHDSLKLGGEEKVLTVLFSDIRGFTSISEGLSPEQLVHLVNTYLSLMTGIILEQGGTVDKYIGDAIMAIYGAPVFTDEHPEQACRTALRMFDALERVDEQWKAEGFPELKIGVGVNTGSMVVGNMGSEERFDYTVMGDSVNLASRLEGLTKAYGIGVIVSEGTAEKISGFIMRDLDLVRVKGKDRPIKIFELLGEGEPGAALADELDAYASALSGYRSMRWEHARAGFEALSESTCLPLYGMYAERCRAFISSPPPEDWDGVYTFTTK